MPNNAAALIAAVRARDTDVAEKLLAAGAPPDARDEGIGSFETVRVTTRTATASVQTAHVAILTDAEEHQGIPEILRRAGHTDPEVRRQVLPEPR